MSKKALRKDFYMEIRKSLGRFLSIFFIVAIGVAFFSGIRASEPDMRYSGDEYFDEKKLMDIQVISTMGLTDDDVQALKKVDGIETVEAGYSRDAICKSGDNQYVVRIMSLLPTMNQVTVEEGRLPEKSDECVVDVNFLEEYGYKIGEEITFSSGTKDNITDSLKTDKYKIVGAVSSPCYISFQRGSTTIGTGTINGFVCVPEDSFSMDAYTELYATVEGAGALTAFTDAYENRVKEVQDNVEAIKEEREDARYYEIIDEANEKVSDAEQELADAKDEANKKLDDARVQIEDGEKQLADGQARITDGISQLDSAQAQIDSGWIGLQDSSAELVSGQQALDAQIAQTNVQVDELNRQIDTLNQLKEQYQALLASQQADEATLQAMAQQIAEGDARIEAAKQQFQSAQAQFDAAQAEINNGWAQIEQGKAQLNASQTEIDTRRAELANAESELDTKKQELMTARAEYEDALAEADEKFADGEKKVADAKKDVSKIEHAKWYIYDREHLTEYSGYGENADRMRAIGKVFPVLFFLVAALISLTTMTRMVEEQRTQIGTMKALGYSRHSIAGKYLGYAFIATALGCVAGVLFGEKAFPYVIVVAYKIMYQHIPNVVIPYDLSYAAMASGAALLCTILATFFSCFRELREQSAQLMRPPAPKQGKRVLLERMPFIWSHLNFTWKATIRNLVRYKKRFFMTIFGIGGCMALLLVGFGLQDSIVNIPKLQFHELQLNDGSLILNEDASQEAQDTVLEMLQKDSGVEDSAVNLMQKVTVSHGDESEEVYLTVPEDVRDFEKLYRFRSRVTRELYSLNDRGTILTEKMANLLDVKVGDTVTVQDDAKGEIEVKIAAICENYLQHYLYMTPDLYEQLYGESPEYNSVSFSVRDGNVETAQKIGEKLLKEDGALSVTYSKDFESQLNDMLGALDTVIVVLVISAGLLAFVVLYNLNNINITERKRELATLKVLGFYPKEVAEYVYRENIILTVAGALVGIGLGKLLHRFIISTVEIESAMFGRNIDFSSFIYGFLITVAFSLFVNGVMYFKLKKIDMVESLKGVE